MLLTLYDRYGNEKAELQANDSSRQDKAVQGDNVLSLGFTLYEHVSIDVNDYVDFCGERYWALEQYEPAEKSSVEWEYNVKLYGIESLIKRFLVLNNTDGENEAVFTLTARPVDHVRLIVKCINDGMDQTTNFKVGSVEGTDNVVINYEGKYCDEALKELADAVGVEWWIEGETVNLSRCEFGSYVVLGYGEGLTSLEQDKADNVKFYTRLFPIGSSRNIDRETYGASRLQLPGGAKYVDLPDLVEKYGVIHHYEQEAFSGIYPRRVGEVSSVRSEEVEDSDGKPFTIWYFKDDGLTFDPNDYEIGGLVKHVSFQEGSELAGLGAEDGHYFEVNYDSETHEFEIITTWPYDDDRQLPGDTLVPQPRDKYILWNIRMPDEYYTLAEKEFQTSVEEYNRKHVQDVSLYKGGTDHVWIEETGTELEIGRRVRLKSQEYFPSLGYRDSRITRISRSVNLPSQMDIEISDALSSGTLEKIDDAISDAKSYAGSILGAVNVPDLIRSWDKTKPTDNNIYSARRTHKEFLSKNTADRAKKKIVFDEGIEAGDFESGERGGYIDGHGNAELKTLVVRQLLRSARFVDGFGGEGWQLWMDEQGLSNLTIDKLTVRQVMTVFELLIEKIRSVGGQIVVSAANGKIKTVEEVDGYYKITFEQENTFVPHDLMRCQTFTGGTIKSYWVEVAAAVDGNSVLVERSEFDASLPAEGDEVVLMGNTEDTKRQNLVLISATEDGQPRIDVMNGVRSKSFEGCLRARLGNLDGIKDPWFPDVKGDGLFCDNAYLRGTFQFSNGLDLSTRFSITDGKIQSSVEALREDFVEEKGFLSNPSFNRGLESWEIDDAAMLYETGQTCIIANSELLSTKESGAALMYDDSRRVMRIKNTSIIQRNASMRAKPEIVKDTDGIGEPALIHFSVLVKVISSGTLTVGFEGETTEGFHSFLPFSQKKDLAQSDSYQMVTMSGVWTGTGDFKFEFTGELYAYNFIITSDPVEAFTYRYKSLFEQSARLTKLAVAVYDKNEQLLKDTGLMVTPKGTGIYMRTKDKDGNEKIALIGVGETDDDGNTVIKLTADNIKLEGLTTVYDNFKVHKDGTIEAVNAKISGEVNANSGTFSGMLNGANGYFKGFVRKEITVINHDNIQQYLNFDETFGYALGNLDFDKIGSFVVFKDLTEDDRVSVNLLGVNSDVTYGDDIRINKARALVGCTIIMYNLSSYRIGVGGYLKQSVDGSSSSYSLEPNKFFKATCELELKNGIEDIYWKLILGTAKIPSSI